MRNATFLFALVLCGCGSPAAPPAAQVAAPVESEPISRPAPPAAEKPTPPPEPAVQTIELDEGRCVELGRLEVRTKGKLASLSQGYKKRDGSVVLHGVAYLVDRGGDLLLFVVDDQIVAYSIAIAADKWLSAQSKEEARKLRRIHAQLRGPQSATTTWLPYAAWNESEREWAEPASNASLVEQGRVEVRAAGERRSVAQGYCRPDGKIVLHGLACLITRAGELLLMLVDDKIIGACKVVETEWATREKIGDGPYGVFDRFVRGSAELPAEWLPYGAWEESRRQWADD